LLTAATVEADVAAEVPHLQCHSYQMLAFIDKESLQHGMIAKEEACESFHKWDVSKIRKVGEVEKRHPNIALQTASLVWTV